MGKILANTYLQWVTQIDIIRNKLGLEDGFENDVKQNYKINAESMNRLDEELTFISNSNSKYQKDQSYQVNQGDFIKGSYKNNLTDLLNEWVKYDICNTDDCTCDGSDCECDGSYCDCDCNYCECVGCDIDDCECEENCDCDTYEGPPLPSCPGDWPK